jgi:hypothetical protein
MVRQATTTLTQIWKKKVHHTPISINKVDDFGGYDGDSMKDLLKNLSFSDTILTVISISLTLL